MSNALGRLRLMGISIESTYGTVATAVTFVLPLLDLPKIKLTVNKERDVAALGSSYALDSMKVTSKMAEIDLNIKLDENQLPLFFRQKFSCSSVTGTESGTYVHTMTYSNSNDGVSYSIFLYDANRTSKVSVGAKFSKLNVIQERGYIRLEASAMGKAPTTYTGTLSVSAAPNEFVGANATFNYGDYTASTSAFDSLNLKFNHEFALSDDSDNFKLGSTDISHIYTKEDLFISEVEALMPDLNNYNDFINNIKKKWSGIITDTNRLLGSATATYPAITFTYPVGYLEQWDENGGSSDLIKQSLTLVAVNEPGVSTAPMQLKVTNTTASYL